jgi:hypothetical protein
MSARWVILDSVRAVAKTWRPCAWKAIAIADPREPVLQPVIRMDALGGILGVLGK